MDKGRCRVKKDHFLHTAVEQWVTCLCVVKFDIDIGHILVDDSLVHPFEDPPLTSQEIGTAIKLSLPDYNSMLTSAAGDLVYCYRLRLESKTPLSPSTLSLQQFLYGYVFFRTEKNPLVPRKFVQTSVVALSPLPVVGVFKTVISLVGSAFFEAGPSVLVEALEAIAAWPPPSPGLTVVFNFHDVSVPLMTGNQRGVGMGGQGHLKRAGSHAGSAVGNGKQGHGGAPPSRGTSTASVYAVGRLRDKEGGEKVHQGKGKRGSIGAEKETPGSTQAPSSSSASVTERAKSGDTSRTSVCRDKDGEKERRGTEKEKEKHAKPTLPSASLNRQGSLLRQNSSTSPSSKTGGGKRNTPNTHGGPAALSESTSSLGHSKVSSPKKALSSSHGPSKQKEQKDRVLFKTGSGGNLPERSTPTRKKSDGAGSTKNTPVVATRTPRSSVTRRSGTFDGASSSHHPKKEREREKVMLNKSLSSSQIPSPSGGGNRAHRKLSQDSAGSPGSGSLRGRGGNLGGGRRGSTRSSTHSVGPLPLALSPLRTQSRITPADAARRRSEMSPCSSPSRRSPAVSSSTMPLNSPEVPALSFETVVRAAKLEDDEEADSESLSPRPHAADKADELGRSEGASMCVGTSEAGEGCGGTLNSSREAVVVSDSPRPSLVSIPQGGMGADSSKEREKHRGQGVTKGRKQNPQGEGEQLPGGEGEHTGGQTAQGSMSGARRSYGRRRMSSTASAASALSLSLSMTGTSAGKSKQKSGHRHGDKHSAVELARQLEGAQQLEPGMFREVNVYACLHTLAPFLWHLWELILCGDPVLVLSPSAEMCSDTVLALLSLISPVEYSGDFRPYFNTFDPDFRTLQKIVEAGGGNRERESESTGGDSSAAGNAGVVLGVTNPFFLEAMSCFPNVVAVEVSRTLSPPARPRQGASTRGALGWGQINLSSSSGAAVSYRQENGDGLTASWILAAQGSCLSKDRKVLKTLVPLQHPRAQSQQQQQQKRTGGTSTARGISEGGGQTPVSPFSGAASRVSKKMGVSGVSESRPLAAVSTRTAVPASVGGGAGRERRSSVGGDVTVKGGKTPSEAQEGKFSPAGFSAPTTPAGGLVPDEESHGDEAVRGRERMQSLGASGTRVNFAEGADRFFHYQVPSGPSHDNHSSTNQRTSLPSGATSGARGHPSAVGFSEDSSARTRRSLPLAPAPVPGSSPASSLALSGLSPSPRLEDLGGAAGSGSGAGHERGLSGRRSVVGTQPVEETAGGDARGGHVRGSGRAPQSSMPVEGGHGTPSSCLYLADRGASAASASGRSPGGGERSSVAGGSSSLYGGGAGSRGGVDVHGESPSVAESNEDGNSVGSLNLSHTAAAAAINNTVVRKHFGELTEAFLEPFARFLNAGGGQGPSQQQQQQQRFLPSTPVPECPPFNEDRFLDQMEPKGAFASLPRRRCKELYKRFIASQNFRPWMEKETAHTTRLLRSRHLSACLKSDHEALLQEQQLEVLIDICTNIKSHLLYSAKLSKETQSGTAGNDGEEKDGVDDTGGAGGASSVSPPSPSPSPSSSQAQSRLPPPAGPPDPSAAISSSASARPSTDLLSSVGGGGGGGGGLILSPIQRMRLEALLSKLTKSIQLKVQRMQHQSRPPTQTQQPKQQAKEDSAGGSAPGPSASVWGSAAASFLASFQIPSLQPAQPISSLSSGTASVVLKSAPDGQRPTPSGSMPQPAGAPPSLVPPQAHSSAGLPPRGVSEGTGIVRFRSAPSAEHVQGHAGALSDTESVRPQSGEVLVHQQKRQPLQTSSVAESTTGVFSPPVGPSSLSNGEREREVSSPPQPELSSGANPLSAGMWDAVRKLAGATTHLPNLLLPASRSTSPQPSPRQPAVSQTQQGPEGRRSVPVSAERERERERERGSAPNSQRDQWQAGPSEGVREYRTPQRSREVSGEGGGSASVGPPETKSKTGPMPKRAPVTVSEKVEDGRDVVSRLSSAGQTERPKSKEVDALRPPLPVRKAHVQSGRDRPPESHPPLPASLSGSSLIGVEVEEGDGI